MIRWIVRGVVSAVMLAMVFGLAEAQTPMSKSQKKPAVVKPPKATAAESLKVAPGFKVELLYAVPQEKYGSWVNLCVDPKGRLIVSDQYGKLYRVTPQTDGSSAPKIEPIPAAIGQAQGLLWAFDALYVVVNAKQSSGLYRITSSKNDDTLDRVELLRDIQGGGGEHGPHAVIKHPDGKRLTVVCGNQHKMVDCQTSKVPRHWGEDHLLPRMPDGRGFMKGVKGPGGCMYNVTPDGKNWELFSVGFRNQYDAAYNREGELFTYDADMEWDFNTPWYRPTRINHVTSGSEFGWRNGAGKYPAYYAESLPAILDIGPGSPTGVCFGYGAKFPAKYHDALFICDWSYGKLYAVHLKPQGASFIAEKEEFVSGTPLPLTDVVINPVDGAMYFLIGGRKTQSALYRVTAKDFKDENIRTGDGVAQAVSTRNHLETFHGKQDSKAIDAAWTHLGNPDRFIRAAARVALEFQPVQVVNGSAPNVRSVDQWQTRALNEKDSQKAITALLALTRSTAACPQHASSGNTLPMKQLGDNILAALNSIDFASLTVEQRLELLRVYHVLFNRYGKPDDAGAASTLAKFESYFPTGHRFVDGEMSQLLVYLQSPRAAAKIMPVLLQAPTQEEQIEYARALRVLTTGWTPELRQKYFTWMQLADGYHGGNSFGGFLKQIKDDAVATLAPQEKITFKAFIEAKPNPNAMPLTAKKVVKEYKLAELLPIVEKGLAAGRSYERGRKLFAEAQCAACHRFDNDGGISGPDLTQAAGRFSTKDLLESILDPNKEISDQYGAVEIETEDGKKLIGRIVNHNGGGGMIVNTNMLDPNATVTVKSDNIASIKPSKQSMMPAGTLDVLRDDEILELMAYLLSRGDRAHPAFKK